MSLPRAVAVHAAYWQTPSQRLPARGVTGVTVRVRLRLAAWAWIRLGPAELNASPQHSEKRKKSIRLRRCGAASRVHVFLNLKRNIL
jgi:hypothetical protein